MASAISQLCESVYASTKALVNQAIGPLRDVQRDLIARVDKLSQQNSALAARLAAAERKIAALEQEK